jgi:intracellular septation protein A
MADFSVVRAVVACLTWSVASSGIIFLNKYIMDADGFHFPMALSCLGMTTSSVCSYVAVVHLKVIPQTIEINRAFWFGRALPIGVFGALTLYFGNLAYLYISVPFIQMLKGMTPIITLVIGVLFGIDAFTMPLCASLAIIGLGVALSSYAEASFVLAGFLAMVAAETAEAGKVVLMQKLMAGNKLHVLEGLLCFAPPCAMSLFFGVLFLEWDGMVSVGFGKMAAKPALYLTQGLMGFVVNLLILSVIKSTSSVTFKVVSMMKNVAVVVGSIPLFGSDVTFMQGVGYAVSMGGFAMYQWARSLPGHGAPHAHSVLKSKDGAVYQEDSHEEEDDPLCMKDDPLGGSKIKVQRTPV